MADIKQVSETYAVAPQIDVDDFESLRDAGFKMVINNRPDGESFGQMDASTAKLTADKAGLDFAFVPISGPQDFMASCDILNKAIENAGGPILAYCRSGTRSVTLWSLASVKVGRETPASAIEKARNAGYDLSHMKETFEQLTSD